MESSLSGDLAAGADDVAERILTAVADSEGCDALELPPLYEVIDTDALAGLFQGDRDAGAVTVTFDYHGYCVTVSDGDVALSGA